MVNSIRQHNLTHLESGNGGTGDLLNPVITAVHHGMESIFMFDEQLFDAVTRHFWRVAFHHPGYFRIAFH